MEIDIKGIPDTATKYDVMKKLAETLHSPEFHPTHDEDFPEKQRLLNFLAEVNPNEKLGGARNDGSGTLTLPTWEIGRKFLAWTKQEDKRIVMRDTDNKKHKLRFFTRGRGQHYVTMTLQRTPYIDPEIELEHAKIVDELREPLRVTTVQFGVFHYPQYTPVGPIPSREFSIEWQREYVSGHRSAWLMFHYDHKLISIRTQTLEEDMGGCDIQIPFHSIKLMAVGAAGPPYICFDLLTPPMFEASHLSDYEGVKQKVRVASLHPGHADIAPFAWQLRLVLYDDKSYVDEFQRLCSVAGIYNSDYDGSTMLRNMVPRWVIKHGRRELSAPQNIEATAQRKLFNPKTLRTLRKSMDAFPWLVAFQLEALLYNGRLFTPDLQELLPLVHTLCDTHTDQYIADLLRKYSIILDERDKVTIARTSPAKEFMKVRDEYKADPENVKRSPGYFPCGHVTFTPTRMLLEGPYPTQSNRVIRQYAGYEDNFLRVDFRDEDRLQYRWDRAVDGAEFVRKRVGGILKEGFSLAGRRYTFLAYSTSALREHAVWFVTPFDHNGIHVDAGYIRSQIGDFRGTKLSKQPSKLAARIGQAFTATDPSVKIRRDQWEEIEDIQVYIPNKEEPCVFTDGAGTISMTLAKAIWAELCRGRRDRGNKSIQPSVFQIRFLGYKGVVAVDPELDKHPTIKMRLRKSMNKFETHDKDSEADIEIARAFDQPNECYLNRPLITVLEDQKVPNSAFMSLQYNALAEARTIRDSLDKFRGLLRAHSLGQGFRLPHIIEKLDSIGYKLPANYQNDGLNAFFELLRQVASYEVQREVKHQARIALPGSYKLVGVPDEGPTYIGKEGYENVFCLGEGKIAACVQKTGEEREWLEGACTISRSPVAHIGDVQRVYAVRPPEDRSFCAFRDHVNCVILPTQGQRSLASKLGGGDLDGDQYDVVMDSDLLFSSSGEKAADYDAVGTYELDREGTVDDICDFIVNYINSDVLGLLSDRLLIIADQSTEGIRDPDCKKLAALCSQAVDFPKNGIPVDIESDRLPNTLIRCKPDWHAAEAVSVRKTDYYRSERVLGKLFREIELTEANDGLEGKPVDTAPGTDSITRILEPYVDLQRPYGTSADPNDPVIVSLFQHYADEIKFIQSTHTLSNRPGAKLLEAEIVMGTILEKCTQRRWRQGRMWKMRIHSREQIKEVKRKLFPLTNTDPTDEEIHDGLERAWAAWRYGMTQINEPGAKSFSLVALDVILDCLERLGAIRPSKRR